MTAGAAASSGEAAPETRLNWVSFVLLTLIFYAAQHNWDVSLTAAQGFSGSIEDFSAIADGGYLPCRIALILCGLFGGASIVRRRLYRRRMPGILGPLVGGFLVWAASSVAWSEDPALTVRRVIALVMLTACAFAVSQTLSAAGLAKWMFLCSYVYLTVGIVAELGHGTFHPLESSYRFAGTLHPNSQGINCSILLISSSLLAIARRDARPWFCSVMLQALLFLALTKSRTSLLCALSALALSWFLRLPLFVKSLISLAAAWIVSVVVLFSDQTLPALLHALEMGRNDSEIATFTGRLSVWQRAITFVSGRPLAGYGYNSFWSSSHAEQFSREETWVITQAHSTYLDCALGIGVTGCLLLVAIILVAIRRAVAEARSSEDPLAAFPVASLIFAALAGLQESILIQPNLISMLFLVSACSLAFRR